MSSAVKFCAILFITALAACGGGSATSESGPAPLGVMPSGETDPSGDPDDMAVWLDPNDVAASVILVCDKQDKYLIAYDLSGRELWRLSLGRANNVYVRGNTIAFSERDNDEIVVLTMDPATRTARVTRTIAANGFNVYGFCLYRSDRLYGFVSSKTGEVRQYEIESGALVRTIHVGSQSEGMAADDEARRVFIAEEDNGLYAYGAEPGDGSQRAVIDTVSTSSLTADLEGVCIYGTPGGAGYVIVSSQGNDSYAIYDRSPPYAHRGSFEIIPNGAGVDGTQRTDGIEVVSGFLSAAYPFGMFLAHDSEPVASRSVKLVAWEHIADPLGLSK